MTAPAPLPSPASRGRCERRAVAFVDLCSFTAFTEEHGFDVASDVVCDLRASLRAAERAGDVVVRTWLGAGAMLTATSARALAECVLEVRDAFAARSPLALRAGVAAGTIATVDDDVIGAPVHLAARLTQRARAHQVLVAADLASTLHQLVTVHPSRRAPVDGARELLRVGELDEAPVRPVSAPARVARPRPARALVIDSLLRGLPGA